MPLNRVATVAFLKGSPIVWNRLTTEALHRSSRACIRSSQGPQHDHS